MSRVAIVTGAGSNRGIGRATAIRLACDGWSLALLDINREGVEDTATFLEAECSCEAMALECDITSGSDVHAAVVAIAGRYRRVDALVNNAGISRSTPLLQISDDDWDQMFLINAKGTFLVTREVVPIMQRQERGRIVNMSSVAAKRGGGLFGTAHYAAAKAAVLGFTRAVARELAPWNITCNAVAPSMIDTDITGAPLTEEQRASLSSGVPLGRIGTAADVAGVIAFLCSDEASYITGEIVDVNGGLHID